MVVVSEKISCISESIQNNPEILSGILNDLNELTFLESVMTINSYWMTFDAFWFTADHF